MVPMTQLKRAAQEALDYLRTVPDVKEAEVFVASNGNLLARLNYTSHIPSNGVEEPKSLESYGVGLRIAFGTPQGLKAGFGSEPSDISLEGVRRALEKARRGAVHDPEFVSLPRPTGEQRTLYRHHDPLVMRMKDDALVDLGWTTLEGALGAFQASEDLLAIAGSPEGVKGLGLILGGDVTVLQERIAIASTHFRRVQTDESTIILSFLTAMVESQYAKGTSWSAHTHLGDYPSAVGAEAARNAIASIGGQRVPDGQYRVVFGRQAVTDLFHNLVLPGLGLELFYAGASPFQGKLTRQIASEGLTVYDDGAAPGLAGSKGITCEGLPTGRTTLIEKGRLTGLLANYYESQRVLRDPNARAKLGVDPNEHTEAVVPRNGFRFGHGGGRNFDSPPGVGATNVVIEGERGYSQEELLRLVGDGLYIGRIWYTYPINGISAGDFTCTVVGDSYLIKGGRLAAPIKPNTLRINDSIHHVLNNVLGVTRERKGTIVWAADQIVYAPEMAVASVTVKEIAGYMEGL